MLGDFDRDGAMDLAVADQGSVMLLRNLGGTSFQAPVVVDAAGAQQLIAADLDGDGRLDLLSSGGLSRRSPVHILRGGGDGTFPASTSFAGVVARSLALVDLNNDGASDIATASGGITVLLSDGRGGFLAGRSAGARGGDLVAGGDFDGDHVADLVTDNPDPGLTLLGAEVPWSAPPVSFDVNASAVTIRMADLDGDGLGDVVAPCVSGVNDAERSVQMIFGGAQPGSPPGPRRSSLPLPLVPRDLATGDFDEDGRADLALIGNRSTTVLVFLQVKP